MSANADIQTRTHKDVISVPINAVTTRDKGDTLDSKVSAKASEKKDDNSPAASIAEDDLDCLLYTSRCV